MDSEQNQNNINSTSESELEACKKQAEEYLNNWKRERADFLNYKKDEVKRMGEFIKFANEGLILELLDALDDLYLAAREVKNPGLDQVVKKFEDFLKKFGVEKVEVSSPSTDSTDSQQAGSGQVKFDPMRHEIVSIEGDPATSPTGDNGASKIEEVRAGYTMHGRVIRPTRIRIIK